MSMETKKTVKKSVKKVVKKTITKEDGFDFIGVKNSLSKDAEYIKVRDALLKFAKENHGQVVICYGNEESHDCEITVMSRSSFVAKSVIQLMKDVL